MDAPGGMIRQAGQDVGEPSLWIDVVEFGGGDEGVDGCGATAALGGAGESPVSLLYVRQSSNFSWASARDRNQCALRHSARKRPLNASMKALSVGLPGFEKSSVTPR